MAEVEASPASPWEDFGQVDTLGFASAGKEGARAVAQEGGFYFDMLQHVGGEGDAVMGQGGRRIMWAAAADRARASEAEVAARAWDRTRQPEQVETGDRTGPAAATGGRCPWWGPGQA